MTTDCQLCGVPALYGTGFCRPCIEAERESARCPDCDSIVTIAAAEGVDRMHVWVEHDATCPALRPRDRAEPCG